MKVVLELNIEEGSPVTTHCANIGAFIVDFGEKLASFNTDITSVTHRDKIIAELRNDRTNKVYIRARVDDAPFDTTAKDDPNNNPTIIPRGDRTRAN